MAKIYLLATNTKKPVSHLITAYTGEKFNHASIAFDKALAECYSFNMGSNGFVRELKEEWPAWTEFELYEVRVTDAALRKARDYVRKISGEKMTFSYRGILGVAMGRPLASAEAFFCSEFVEQTCIRAGLARSTEHASLATPLGVCKRKDAKLVAAGRLHEYMLLQGGGRGIFEQTQRETKDMILEEDGDVQLVGPLTEGLGSFLKNLVTGDIEEEIDELEKEAADIHTPEQQRFVLTKIIRTLERLIILRHNPSAVQKFAHDHISYFQKHLGGKEAGKELPVRTGEAITRLARLRDKVLAKRWPDDVETEKIEAYKKRIRDVLDSASKTHKDTLD